MKNQLIATLVGGVILFVWQFLSWSFLGVHQSEMQYTPNQDSILQVLTEQIGNEGTYFMPGLPPGTPSDQHMAEMEKMAGKPWAVVSYHKAMNTSMGMNMFRGFVIDLIAAYFLVWVLLRFPSISIATGIKTALAVGFIGYLTIPYLDSIWFETGSVGYLIDTLVQWGLTGLWLGWYLGKGQRA